MGTKIKSRKRSGSPGTKLSSPQSIKDKKLSTIINDGILRVLNSKSAEEFDTWFDALPANVQAQFISLYIPKKKDTDQSLTESHLSLTESYRHLPNIVDLTQKIRALERVNRKITIELATYQTYFNRVVKGDARHNHTDMALEFFKIMRDALGEMTKFMEGVSNNPINLQDIREMAQQKALLSKPTSTVIRKIVMDDTH
jgi:hypothetical protein